jgi:hypothetical protein
MKRRAARLAVVDHVFFVAFRFAKYRGAKGDDCGAKGRWVRYIGKHDLC